MTTKDYKAIRLALMAFYGLQRGTELLKLIPKPTTKIVLVEDKYLNKTKIK